MRAAAAAHDEIDPWADSEAAPVEVDLGQDLPRSPPSPTPSRPIVGQHPSPSSLPSQPSLSARRKPFRTAPLTSLPPRHPHSSQASCHDPLLEEGPRRRSGATTPLDTYSYASGSEYRSPTTGRARSGSAPLSPLSSLSLSTSADVSASPLGASSLASSPSGPRTPSGSRTPSGARPHPALAGLGGLGGAALSDLRDVSRPGLARATSETERAASVGSWSATNSDFGEAEDDELVDVIVHHMGGESLAGIALRYGIELAALRRANKLWPSDPVPRTQLFVPLEQCRASADAWIMRDGDGATLVRRHARRPSREEGRDSPASLRTVNGEPLSPTPTETPRVLPDTPGDGHGVSVNGGGENAKKDKENETETLEHIPLEIARVPASKLRFFPHKKARGRSSLEADFSIGRNADSVRALAGRSRPGLFAALALSDDVEDEYEPRPPHRVTVRSGQYAEGGRPVSPTKDPAKSPKAKTNKSKVVRLRPPAAAPPPPPGAGIASRISNFFSVPPPPSHMPPPVRLVTKAQTRASISSADTGTRIGDGRSLPSELVEMEMDSAPGPKQKPKSDKKRD